ncbi:MAG: hypothetical protein R6W89_05075 [Candidatus Hydrogenedentota bacterium]
MRGGMRDLQFSWRLKVLLVILALCLLGGTFHHGRVMYHENKLTEIGEDIVREINEEDPRPVPEEGPQADVEIEATCAFAYLVFGEMSGKVRLITLPREHAPIDEPYVIAYEFEREDGEWAQTNSYHEH